MQHSAYLSLGSNIQPQKNIPMALKLMSELLTLVEVSSAWRTKAVGSSGPDFVNLAAHVLTDLDLSSLKDDVLYHIELRLGRVRTEDKFAPRPIDLDISIFDGEVIDPNTFKYNYLVLPLAELLPGLSLMSDGATLKDLAGELITRSSATRLADFPDSRG